MERIKSKTSEDVMNLPGNAGLAQLITTSANIVLFDSGQLSFAAIVEQLFDGVHNSASSLCIR